MAILCFFNEQFNHSFSCDVTPKTIEREIRAWKKLGYTLIDYYYCR